MRGGGDIGESDVIEKWHLIRVVLLVDGVQRFGGIGQIVQAASTPLLVVVCAMDVIPVTVAVYVPTADNDRISDTGHGDVAV